MSGSLTSPSKSDRSTLSSIRGAKEVSVKLIGKGHKIKATWRVAYSSTGEVIDVATRKIVAALEDEKGRAVESEKLLDITIANGKVVRAGNQFGVGMKAK